MDWSARDLGLDPVELRRRNFIPKEKFPYRSVSGETYDVGDFGRVLDRALIEADVAGLRGAQGGERRGRAGCAGSGSPTTSNRSSATRTRRRRSPSPRTAWSSCSSAPSRTARGTRRRSRRSSHERSGMPFEKIRFVQGDSDRIAQGGGTGGSRSVTMQGNSINHAADVMIERFRPLAEEELEVGRRRPRVRGRRLPHRRHRPRRRPDAARRGGARGKGRAELLVTTREFVVPGRSYPNGAHFAEVEVDPRDRAGRGGRSTRWSTTSAT